MRLPTPLLRRNTNVHKNRFGHVCILAGSRRMLGAAALASLAALRTGAGLVSVGVPKSLNTALQKKIAHAVMTLPLAETKEQSLAFAAYPEIRNSYVKFDAIAIGPGLSMHPSTQKLVLKIIAQCPKPLVIDADALNALSQKVDILAKTPAVKILTPHPGEMSRLTKLTTKEIEHQRARIARKFAGTYNCVLLLKGHQTVVAAKNKKVYINTTGNPGMATAGSGDVLTGMIAALIGQGLSGFEAAKWGAYLHGKAGDLAAKAKTRAGMMASDIIDSIPKAIKKIEKRK